jgi:hypothetical protein
MDILADLRILVHTERVTLSFSQVLMHLVPIFPVMLILVPTMRRFKEHTWRRAFPADSDSATRSDVMSKHSYLYLELFLPILIFKSRPFWIYAESDFGQGGLPGHAIRESPALDPCPANQA